MQVKFGGVARPAAGNHKENKLPHILLQCDQIVLQFHHLLYSVYQVFLAAGLRELR